MNTHVKTNFWGASMQISTLGMAYVYLPNHKEMYSILRPTTLIHNLIFGTLYLEHVGPMVCKRISSLGKGNQISSLTENQFEFIVDFVKAGWTKSNRNKVEATIPVRPESNKNWKLWGKWDEGVWGLNEETKKTI